MGLGLGFRVRVRVGVRGRGRVGVRGRGRLGVGLGVAQAGVTHSLVVRAQVAEGEIEARSREMGARSLLGPA